MLSTNLFEKYLKSKNILIVSECEDYQKSIDDLAVLDQLIIIKDFHDLTMGYREFIGNSLNNNTGKVVEQYAVNIKKFKRFVEDNFSKENKNEFEVMLINKSQDVIARSEECMKVIYDSNYLELLRRSMERAEICIGNSYFNNIRRNENIEISSLKRCSYNMIEFDAIFLLGKIKRKSIKLNWNELINKYCSMENLSSDSEMLIKAVISYPKEFFKCFREYKKNSINYDVEEYIHILKKAIEKDGESLI